MILIDMKMPRTCAVCEWSDYLHPNAYCRREQTTVNIETAKTSRPEWCPLIEVPTPHGRLIDADFEEAHYASMTINPTPDVTEQDKRSSIKIIQALKMAKTVIPAER